ncbi:MAG: ribosome biogenesis GTPase Der, partial [Planctomycetota bacterium]|nr:ribosome biogenesis GTPase Der [Planctomycetota bacterium]
GYGVYTADGARFNEVGEDLSKLGPMIERQIAHAMASADLILFVVDAQTGLTTLDESVARILRKGLFKGESPREIPVIVIANKTDSDKWIPDAMEAAGLGFGEPIYVSALNSRYKRHLMERIYEALPERIEERDEDAGELKLAIVGKRNAGKSTYVNALAGEERVLVSEIAGTTRDSVDVRVQIGDKSLTLIDTAGFRKKKSLPDQIEWHAMNRALDGIRRADVVFLLIDAAEPVSQIDKHLAREIADQFKPCVIVVNKWDLAEHRKNRKGQPITPDDYLEYLSKEIKGLPRAPIVFISAADKRGVTDPIGLAFELREQALQRIPTGQLNTTLRNILKARGPSSKLGTRAKIYYVTQVAVAPPTIVMVVNKDELFTPDYQRYMLNRIAEETPFEEVPVRLIIRERKRADLASLLSGEHRAEREAAAAAWNDDDDVEDGHDEIDDDEIIDVEAHMEVEERPAPPRRSRRR